MRKEYNTHRLTDILCISLAILGCMVAVLAFIGGFVWLFGKIID